MNMCNVYKSNSYAQGIGFSPHSSLLSRWELESTGYPFGQNVGGNSMNNENLESRILLIMSIYIKLENCAVA